MVLSEQAAGLRGSKLNPSSLLFYRHNVHAAVFNLLNRHSLVRNFIVYWAPASCGGLPNVHPVRDYKIKKNTEPYSWVISDKNQMSKKKISHQQCKAIFFLKITKRGYLYVNFFVRIMVLCSGNFYDAEAEGL